MKIMGNPLIIAAKNSVCDNRKRRKFTDDEITLAGEWFEGGVTNIAVAKVLGINRKNVQARMAACLKQGIRDGRVSFIWHRNKKGDHSEHPFARKTGSVDGD